MTMAQLTYGAPIAQDIDEMIDELIDGLSLVWNDGDQCRTLVGRYLETAVERGREQGREHARNEARKNVTRSLAMLRDTADQIERAVESRLAVDIEEVMARR
jgi:flagellar biosynthesis/type III secretory pathway protein FliH